MKATFIEAPGLIVQPSALRVPRAVALAQALIREDVAYATLIECRSTSNDDVIVFDVEAEVPQRPVHSINRVERIAAIFQESDETVPEVLALRADFPKVPHLTLRDHEFPRGLCLYEEPFHELKRRWTAPRFVEHVRQWLALTAKGKLHQDDQPLEPLLYGNVGQIILPHHLLQSNTGEIPERLYVTATDTKRFLIAHCEKLPEPFRPLPIAVSVHYSPPQQHGVIHKRPGSLAELTARFQDLGFDLLNELRTRLRTWWEKGALDEEARNSPLVLIVVCPKTRQVGMAPENIDIWALATGCNLEQVGGKIGIWESSGGHLCPFLIIDEAKNGEDVLLDLLNSTLSHLLMGWPYIRLSARS